MDHYFERYFRPKITFDKPGDDGASGNSPVNLDWPEDVLKGFRSLISREGDEQKAAMKLYDENYEHRKKIRELEARKTLTDEEYEQFEKYKEMGKPDELKTKIEAADTAASELSAIKKEKAINEAAEVLGWNPKVLNRLGSDLEYEVKTKTGEDGKAVKYVEAKDGDKVIVVTDDFAKEKFGEEFLPSLKKEASNTTAGNQDGKTFPSQSSASSSSSDDGDDLIAGRLEKNKKARGIEAK